MLSSYEQAATEITPKSKIGHRTQGSFHRGPQAPLRTGDLIRIVELLRHISITILPGSFSVGAFFRLSTVIRVKRFVQFDAMVLLVPGRGLPPSLL